MYWVDMGMLYLLWILEGYSCNQIQKYFAVPHSTSGEVLKFMRSHVIF
jgi:hypothetical protein